MHDNASLQQYLPFTVLKRTFVRPLTVSHSVATVLTVYGIETNQGDNCRVASYQLQQYLPFTVLKLHNAVNSDSNGITVATVLTVYGIETYVQQKVLE